jgi:hypothetical protein
VPFAPPLLGLHEAGPDKPYDWTVAAPGLTWTEPGPAGHSVTVEAGFRTDLASTPRFLSWLVPRYGKYTKAAVVHDYLCQHLNDLPTGEGRLELRDRSDADAAFLTMMTELDVPWARRLLMYDAVSWATVLTVLTTRRANGGVWLARVLILLLVVALIVLLASGALGDLVDADGTARWFQVGAVVTVLFTIAAAWVMLCGALALGRADRLLPYLGAGGFTVLSLPLIVGGLAVGVLLVLYLLIEDIPSGLGNLRARLRQRGKPDNPRQQRLEATEQAVA